jgi:hypothetical protein
MFKIFADLGDPLRGLRQRLAVNKQGLLPEDCAQFDTNLIVLTADSRRFLNGNLC